MLCHAGFQSEDAKTVSYMEWTEGRGNSGKECASTDRKTGQLYIWRQDHASVAQAMYTTTR